MSIPLPFNLVDLPLINKLAIVTINFITFSLIFTVLTHSRLKDIKSKIFFVMSFLMLTWVDFAYVARLIGINSFVYSELALRIAWVATPMLFYFTFLISAVLIRDKKINKYLAIALLFLSSILSLITAFSNLIISGITFVNTNLDIVYGKGFYPFLVGIFVLMIFTLYPIFKKKPDKKTSIFLLGVFIFYLANLIFNIALPVFFGITHLYYFGDYSTLFLLSFTAFAIVRHKLFDIRVAATEVLIIIIWSILFSKLFVYQNTTELAVNTFVFMLTIVFGIMLIKSVIREIKQKEQLKALNKQLKELDARKDEFINIAAHELRSPTTAIKGYVSMVLGGDAGQITPEAKDFLEEAFIASNRMTRLINNLLDVQRIEENRIIYSEGVYKVSDIAQEVYKETELEASRKGLTLKLQVDPNLIDGVYVDKDRLFEVVLNFVNNALKYTPQGGIKISLLNPNHQTIRVEVSDTGPGISMKEQEKLFTKFYRVESKIGKTTGSGLGLYISKLLITKFGGTIGVISSEDVGTTFWFELQLNLKANEQ